MKIAIIGAGGVGCHYGAMLSMASHEVHFIARGEHLRAMQKNGLEVKHTDYYFNEKVVAYHLEGLLEHEPSYFDALIVLTKAVSTKDVALFLAEWFKGKKSVPYVVSLQNGVENEEILVKYLGKECVIGGLSRKIGAHVISSGVVDSVGEAESIVGLMQEDKRAKEFLEFFSDALNKAGIPTHITLDIQKELWKKLIINNGVNALCALLKVRTGELFEDEGLSALVYSLMQETAEAARKKGIKIDKSDVDSMFALIKGFDSIKPSMLVDLEHGRALEIEEICGVVIRTLGEAPYTKSISTLLSYTAGARK